MNDEWSRCPICFEDYSINHRPTTFECGHSTCIDHVTGREPLQFCKCQRSFFFTCLSSDKCENLGPICRHRLRPNYPYHVSYNLQEASQLFQLIKDKIDWSTIQPVPAVEVRDSAQISAAESMRRDEVYARRLQTELNRQPVIRQPTAVRARAAPVVTNRPPPDNTATNTPQRDRPVQQGPHTNVKSCGHACDLRSTQRCCACSGNASFSLRRRWYSQVPRSRSTTKCARSTISGVRWRTTNGLNWSSWRMVLPCLQTPLNSFRKRHSVHNLFSARDSK